MKKAYIVTSGKYSDYKIDGVFSTRAKAQAFIDAFAKGEWQSMSIEEHALDPFAREIGRGWKPYFIRIDAEGNTSDCRVEDSTYGFEEGDNSIGFDIDGDMYMHIFAKDEDHAGKIAGEKQFKCIAEGKWNPSGRSKLIDRT